MLLMRWSLATPLDRSRAWASDIVKIPLRCERLEVNVFTASPNRNEALVLRSQFLRKPPSPSTFYNLRATEWKYLSTCKMRSLVGPIFSCKSQRHTLGLLGAFKDCGLIMKVYLEWLLTQYIIIIISSSRFSLVLSTDVNTTITSLIHFLSRLLHYLESIDCSWQT